MKNYRPMLIGLATLLMLTGCSDEGANPTDPGDGSSTDPVSFAHQIQPIFDANCVGCHGISGNAGLDLRPNESHGNLISVAAQASSGTLVVPLIPDQSVLYNRMTGNGLGTMPPAGSLGSSTLDLVRRWIAEGAQDN